MSFAESFWSADYEQGFRVLFEQLYEGVKENEDFITLFSRRMDSEFVYGTQLEDIELLKPVSKRMNSDDYVSTAKNAFQKLDENFVRQGQCHLEIANNIRVMVLDPFSNWCKEHKKRVEYSERTLNDKHKLFKLARAQVERLQKKYFNKCRMLEEFKLHYTEDELQEEIKDLEFAATHGPATPAKEEEEDQLQYQIYKFGNVDYDYATIKSLLLDILAGVPIADHKVAILGTYHHVSTGSDITQWLLDHIPDFNIAKAEKFGQDLINNGFIRVIGTMLTLKLFINSLQFYYQWKPVVFEITGVLMDTDDAASAAGTLSRDQLVRTLQISEYFEDMKQAMGVLLVDFSDRSQLSKLMTEVKQYDTQYRDQVTVVDDLRMEFEQLIMDHLTFMQKCELDRLKAVKKVTFDFMAAVSNKITLLKKMCDELAVVEETINPVNDLKFLIEDYGTGKFNPQVVLYDNYYNSNINQTFGVDLAVKLRLDKKVVPIIIQCMLLHLDKVYPEVANDDERVALWTKPIHLTLVHKLRRELNPLFDPAAINDVLAKNHPIIVTNALKLYFMELPDLIVPHSYYELILSLYQTYPVSDTAKELLRIVGVQNVLLDLPLCNLATLDALITHLKRLVLIIGAKNPELATLFLTTLYKEFAPLVVRPREGADLDKHLLSFLSDLFTHKDQIFKELRRRNSLKPTAPRAGSVTSAAPEMAKSRLESRLQQAVKPKRIALETPKIIRKLLSHKETKILPQEPMDPAKTLLTVRNSDHGGSTLSLDDFADALADPANDLTPVLSPSKGAKVKRLSLPTKKKHLKDAGPSDRSPRGSIVSSRPSRKDIVYSDDDMAPPQFRSIGRKGSVKDLATKFDSELRSRSALPTKKSKSKSGLPKKRSEVIEIDD